MNIMSLDAAYGDGTINDMHAVPPPEALAVDGEHQKRVPLNPKIRPMQQLDDNVLNLSGFSKLTTPPLPAQHQGHGPRHGYAPPRALPHPQEFLNAAPPVAGDQLLEQQLQAKLLEQYQLETGAGAGAGAASSPVPTLRGSGGGSRFAKYGDGDGDGAGAGARGEGESSLAAFYARNKIVILVAGIVFCVLLGVLIWVLVCHRKKRAAEALLNAVPLARGIHSGEALPRSVGELVYGAPRGAGGDSLSWEGSDGAEI